MGLSLLDLAVIVTYLFAITLFGLHFRRKQRSLRDYFLADKRISWWAISLSIVAAETSTLTIVSVPGLAYERDFRFLQLVFGYIVGRVIVAFLFIPHYFRGELFTAYEFIDRRFGKRLRTLTAGLFLVTRAAAEGVRVFAVAIVVRIALGGLLSGMSDYGRDVSAIAIVTLLTLVYTFEGGMAAVIWTDVVQLGVYLTGTLVAALVLWHAIPGGWSTISSVASQTGKFRVFDFSWNLSSPYTLWSGVVGGAFLTTASHGTDQLIVQRLLSASNERGARFALIASGGAVLMLFSLFLLIGTMLYVFYSKLAPAVSFDRTDSIFPTFISTRMAHGISGLLISAILAAAMSNLSAALNSLSSTTIIDFYARIVPGTAERDRVRLSRFTTLAWGLILFGLALMARHGGKVLEMGLSIASVAYGSLLGVFLLGTLLKSASEQGAMVGMLLGFLLNLYLWRFTHVAFTWYVAFGSVATFLTGYVASWLIKESRSDMKGNQVN
jgi:SSS family solute:Na+ symporter